MLRPLAFDLSLRNKLAFPCGMRPGFDPRHPASNGLVRLSCVAMPGSNRMMMVNKVGLATVSGSASGGIDCVVGPSVNFIASADNNSFSGLPTANDAPFTLAAIFRNNIITGTRVLMSDNSSHRELFFSSATLQVQTGSSPVSATVSVAVGQAYFVAVSVNAAGFFVVLRQLPTGPIRAVSVVSAMTISAPSSPYFIGNTGSTQQLNGAVGAAMWSTASLTLGQLQAWANDPWSFWFPQQGQWNTVGVAAAGDVLFGNQQLFMM